jgi:hypothetical protein
MLSFITENIFEVNSLCVHECYCYFNYSLDIFLSTEQLSFCDDVFNASLVTKYYYLTLMLLSYRVDENMDKFDIPFDVIWLDIEHTDGKR